MDGACLECLEGFSRDAPAHIRRLLHSPEMRAGGLALRPCGECDSSSGAAASQLLPKSIFPR